MSTRRKTIVFFIFCCFIMCNNATDKSYREKQKKSKGYTRSTPREIIIIESSIHEQYFTGYSLEKREFYVCDYINAIKDENKILVKIVDIDNGELKKTKKIRHGNSKSPDEFEPKIHSVHFFRDFYFIENEKLAVFDKTFKWKLSNYYKCDETQFIDFFSNEGKINFVTGNLINKDVKCEFEVLKYELQELKIATPTTVVDRFIVDYSGMEFRKILKTNPVTKKRIWSMFYFVPKIFGFVKDGKIYYSINTENRYYIHDPGTGKKKILKIPLLRPIKFANTFAEEIAQYKSDGSREKQFKKSGSTLLYKASTQPICFMWMLDAGKDKIAFITDIDTERWKMRLDIFNSETCRYIDSLYLPFGHHFTRGLKFHSPTFPRVFLDYDRRIYIYGDREGDDLIDVVRFIRFKFK